MKMYVTGTGGAGLCVRESNDFSSMGNVARVAAEGEQVEVVEIVDGVAVVATTKMFCSAKYLSKSPPGSLMLSAPATRLLGIHELRGGVARDALEHLGARSVCFFNDALGAYTASVDFQDALVMSRIYFTSAWSPEEMMSLHALKGNRNSRVLARGINEYDVAGFGGSPEEILRRATWDSECARRTKDLCPDAFWVAGGFPHGCPDFTKPEVCDAMARGYADLYNSGMIYFDIHNYSKANPANPLDFAFYGSDWFETRFGFLFGKCGFSPLVQRVVSSEGGVETYLGGMEGARYSKAQFRAWAEYILSCLRKSIAVGTALYPSPMAAMTLFQKGDLSVENGHWGGYAVEDYVDEIVSLYHDDTSRGIGAYPVSENVPDNNYIPQRKIIK